MPEITRKPTPRQIEALRTALTNAEGIIEVSADKRTHEGLVGRDLADWKRPELVGRSVHGTALCVITDTGRAYLAELDRPRDVLHTPAGEPLDAERFRPMIGTERTERRDLGGGAAVELVYRVEGLKFKGASRANGMRESVTVWGRCVRWPEGSRPSGGNTTWHGAYCAEVFHSNPAPVEPAVPAAPQERSGATRGFTTTNGETNQTPVLDVEDGDRYRLVPFAPKGVSVEPGHVLAHNVHTGLPNLRHRYAVGTLNGDRVAWQEDGYAWEHVEGRAWENPEGYQVRTEDRGHGIIAVYAKGPANDVKGIERTARAYARRELEFAPGMERGRTGGGGECRDAGATYISQDVYTTRPLTTRTT